ncbi:MAG TPA: hypothetical protein VMU50_04865 [Polyangia bacterium]|nr:hypothetical protein [Polyangia bacterium]
MLNALLHVLGIVALVASWVLAGYALLPARLRRDEAFLVFSTCLALGAGLTAVAVTLAAAAGAMTRPVLWTIQAGVVGLAARGAWELRRLDAPALAPSRWSWPRRLALAALIVVAAATLLATLAPPSSMDAMVYHLRAPRAFLRAGGWVSLPDIVQSFQPLYVEMLFGHAMALYDDVLASLVHWALGIGAVTTAAACSRRLGGSALWGMVIFGASAMFAWESTSAFIDLGLACFTSLALLWATRPDVGAPSWVLAGVFAGLAAGTKLNGAVGAALAGLGTLCAAGPDWRSGARRLVAVGALALALALPWYVRTLLSTGNPFYPVGNALLGQPQVNLASVYYGNGTGVLRLMLSPFDLIWRGQAFDKGWSFGPAYLALLPLGAALVWRTRSGRIAAAAVAVWWLFWFASSQQARLLLPLAPVAAGLASVGARWALEDRSLARPIRWVTTAALAVSAGLGVAVALLTAATNAPAALSLESRTAFLRRNSWHFVAFEQANQLLPRDARVAVVGYGANNLYYLQREATYFATAPGAEALHELRLTHVLDIRLCSAPARAPAPDTARIIWSGSYPLVRSRLRGDADATACARLSLAGQPSATWASANHGL